MSLIKVGILFGGKSGEHDVSIQSAESVLRAIDRSKYLPIPIGINKIGRIVSRKETKSMLSSDLVELLETDSYLIQLSELSGQSDVTDFTLGLLQSDSTKNQKMLDVIFPILHGPNGEDGTIQGLLELMGIPYVGSGVLASSIGMDKEIMKRVFQTHDLPILPFYSFKRFRWEMEESIIISEIETEIGYPNFIKPANMGSSVGITKAHNKNELIKGILEAFRFDRKIVVEKGIEAREIEVALLGNENPEASVPGEIIPANEFYDYEAKYLSEGSKLIIPAPLDNDAEEKIREYAIKAFLALDCAGLSRADFFIDKTNNHIYINELNTMPGFTNISMYPKLWEASGISYSDLIDQLITLALKRYQNKV